MDRRSEAEGFRPYGVVVQVLRGELPRAQCQPLARFGALYKERPLEEGRRSHGTRAQKAGCSQLGKRSLCQNEETELMFL